MVRVKILDNTGHTECVMQPAEALETIRETGDESWVFVDGHVKPADQLTAEELASVAEVLITPALQAG